MQRNTPAIPPRRSTVAVAVQPDYRKWEAVRIGMSRAEVAALIGAPLTGREQRPICSRDPDYPVYGFVSYPALPVLPGKWTMAFRLGFDAAGRVWWKVDPFGGGPLSRTGKPSKPRWITPQSGGRFAHFPRLLDARWFPSSGAYPLTYELEVGLGQSESTEYRGYVDPERYGQPYALLAFPGAQPGRLRVRGRNARGSGPWSDYREFTFDV